MKRALRISLIGVGVLTAALIILFLYHYATHGKTLPITDSEGNIVPGSIASLEKVKLGGVDQFLLIQGKNTSNPVLLSLHGGPGMPQMYLAHAFQTNAENYFTVVQWDRRGAGKSYSDHIPVESMNVEQMISDTYELVLASVSQRYTFSDIHGAIIWGC